MINRQLLIQKLEQISDNTISKEAIADLSRLFTVEAFHLGDNLGTREGADRQGLHELDAKTFYVVCDGKVRLLSCDLSLSKQVSIQLLRAGEVFGGDTILDEVALPYQGIAASKVLLASISIHSFQSWLTQYPCLQNHWATTIRYRQKVIFFKSLTVLSALPTRELELFFSVVNQDRISEGQDFNDLDSTSGRYWLRKGEIQGCQATSGFSWGYPELNTPSAFSTSELFVYVLPAEYWDDVKTITSRFIPVEQDSLPSTRESLDRTSLIEKQKLEQLYSKNQSSPLSEELTQGGRSASPLQVRSPQTLEFPRPFKRTALRRWRRYPFIEQHSSSDCGAACLAMISQYWGKRFSLNWLREIAGIGRSGVSLKNLAKTADALGYQARPVRASLSRLEHQKKPWIAHWDGDHFIVVYEVKKKTLLVADPAQGKKRISRQEFLKSWTGYCLLLEPSEDLYAIPGEKRSLGRFLNLLLPYRLLGLQIILASILIQVFGVISPLFTQIILDQIVVSKSQVTLNVMVLGALLFGVFGIGLSSIRSYLLSYLANQLDLTMISGFVKHTLGLPLKFF